MAKSSETSTATLAAEVLAVKTVIGEVLHRVYQLDPILAGAIERAFVDAAINIRKMAKPGTRISPARAARAIAATEALQMAVLGRSHDRVGLTLANINRRPARPP